MQLLDMPLINCKIKSATDIKLRYGQKHFKKIVDGEENYHLFITGLNNWAKTLIESGCNEDARKVLNFAVKIGSDYKETFWLLKLLNTG
jgi:hypothetical protein